MAFFDPLIIAYPQVQEGEAQPAVAPPAPAPEIGVFRRKPRRKPERKWLPLVKQYLELKLR